MRILLTGANGQLGRELQSQCENLRFELIAAGLPQLDIGSADNVDDIISQYRPSLVINAAAYTQVDQAELETDLACRVNTEGPANLAEACRSVGIALIHLSTDYVFDGKKNMPYLESDPVSPLSVYARTKADGEDRVRSLLKEHIILRTSWLYSVFGHNFVKTMLRLGREGQLIRVVSDQWGSPTSAADLATTILKIAEVLASSAAVSWGTYHYCGKGVTSWYEFAKEIFHFADYYHLFSKPDIEAVSTDQYPTPAKRPQFSALDCRRIHKNFGIDTQPWRESLAVIMKRIAQAGKI